MRKSHLIALFILFIAVTVLIVSQAFTGPESEEILNVPSGAPATVSPTATAQQATSAPTATPGSTQGPAVRPTVDYTKLGSLSATYYQAWSSFDMESLDVIKDTTCFYTKADDTGLDLYLTFNLGYIHQEAKILDLLKGSGIKATFFMPENYIELNKNLGDEAENILKRIVSEGHILGVRGNFATAGITPENFCDKLWAMEETYQSITGTTGRMGYFRPNPTKISARDIAIAEAMGYKVALWSRTLGGETNNALNAMVESMADGIIYSMDTSEALFNVLDDFVTQATGKGYGFKRLDQ